MGRVAEDTLGDEYTEAELNWARFKASWWKDPQETEPPHDCLRALMGPRACEDRDPVKRLPISMKLRYDILARDQHRCRSCGVSADVERLEVDHVVPVARGGTNDPWNLQALCLPCNRGKGSR